MVGGGANCVSSYVWKHKALRDSLRLHYIVVWKNPQHSRGNNYLTVKLHCTSKFNFSIFMTFWCINIYIYIFYFTQNTLWYTEKKRSRLSKNFISSIYCGLNKTHVLWVHNSKYARHDKCLLHAALYALHWWSVIEGGLHVNLERVQIIDWAKPSGQETRQRAMIRFIMEEVYSRDK